MTLSFPALRGPSDTRGTGLPAVGSGKPAAIRPRNARQPMIPAPWKTLPDRLSAVVRPENRETRSREQVSREVETMILKERSKLYRRRTMATLPSGRKRRRLALLQCEFACLHVRTRLSWQRYHLIRRLKSIGGAGRRLAGKRGHMGGVRRADAAWRGGRRAGGRSGGDAEGQPAGAEIAARGRRIRAESFSFGRICLISAQVSRQFADRVSTAPRVIVQRSRSVPPCRPLGAHPVQIEPI